MLAFFKQLSLMEIANEKKKHSKSINFFAYKNIESLTFSVSIAGVAQFMFKVLLIFKIGRFSKSKRRFFDIVKKNKKNKKTKKKHPPPSTKKKEKRKIKQK